MGDMSEPVAGAPPRSARRLLRTVIPALAVGIGSALLFVLVEDVSNGIEHFLWEYLPDQVGFAGSDKWWIITIDRQPIETFTQKRYPNRYERRS